MGAISSILSSFGIGGGAGAAGGGIMGMITQAIEAIKKLCSCGSGECDSCSKGGGDCGGDGADPEQNVDYV